ncbi:FSH1-domain-containing protein [Guyanagaster necrorhizus]|uniref:FSH1-domain-containing protein n=1 Tax=Guyanagaster necrorhizus TaxID=856835 RepID=A0A9P7W1A9_9AGAR|nr:FSH1-domain-containing protein [Guyanagaster necrorhizus MCA 3950]KAG7450782.1 FSH1-domain-containing protein [Guyanagaster necrorhizus MCA 3950]
MTTTTKSILVLHGYAQNAHILSKRLGALRKQCGKDVDMVFIDAPHVLQAEDLFGGASESNENVSEASTNEDPTLTPRGWFRAFADKTRAVGLDDSLILIRDVLKERTYDGVFGFSQGAAVAALLCALLENPESYPPFLIDGKSPHPPLKFCVAVAGLRIMDPLADVLFNPAYSTPTLHIIGKNDVIVTANRTQELIDVSSNKRIEEHDGGHFVPSKTPWRKFLAAYIRDPSADIPSPVLSELKPTSGTATPVAKARP